MTVDGGVIPGLLVVAPAYWPTVLTRISSVRVGPSSGIALASTEDPPTSMARAVPRRQPFQAQVPSPCMVSQAPVARKVRP